MKKIILSLLIIIAGIGYSTLSIASTTDLVSNGDFSSGLTDWSVFGFNPDPPANQFVNATGNMLNWGASEATTGNATGASQILNADVSGYVSLIFKADINAIFQSRISPGVSGFDFPVRVDIAYIDTTDSVQTFRQGFFYSGTDSVSVPGTQVTQNTIFSYASENLMTLSSKPKTISSITILGAGLNYDGSADNVQLLGTPVPEPASIALLGLGLAGFLVRKRK